MPSSVVKVSNFFFFFLKDVKREKPGNLKKTKQNKTQDRGNYRTKSQPHYKYGPF